MKYWDDFNTKWGFHDDEQVPPDAEQIREVTIRILNHYAEARGSKVRYVAFNRWGVHNWCLVYCVEEYRVGSLDVFDDHTVQVLINDMAGEAEPDEIMRDIIADIECGELPVPEQFVETTSIVLSDLLEDALVNFPEAE